MAAFTSNIDITSGGTYNMNITNGEPASQVATDLNGKFANIQRYLQNGLPEVWTGSSLPDSLINSKIVRWINNGYTYIGDSNNNPVQLANYSDIQTLQNSINTLQNADVVIGEYSGNTSSTSSRQDINLGFRPRYVYVSGTMYDSVYFQMEWQYFSVATSSAGNDALYTTDTGFSVSNRSSSYTSTYLNYSGKHYAYISFR